MLLSKKTNRLINETSPYLLQHAENPVDWYPWGPEALEKAKREDKPIFLSIGYSACHWCHVMAHEDFEDEEIAKLMNENFVNIKVDREERPDLDDIYQKVCQILTGTGGWPLSVFLTPDQKPFFAGTYFPPIDRYGMPGFGSILRQLSDTYKNNKDLIERQTKIIMDGLAQTTEHLVKPAKLDRTILDEAAINLLQSGDLLNGGFGPSPKFPNASNLSFLLRYYDLSKISRFRDFVLLTLDKMASGGIHDHIGGGFHRYATDSMWLVPHFEKMLYDNALIPLVYAEAFQITGENKYRYVVKRTLDYVLREMTHPDGGFYSTQDADSEGEEGKYYTWKKSEIIDALGSEEGDIFCMHYGVTQGGNFEGSNILHVSVPIQELARKLSKPVQDIERIIEEGRKKLLQIRDKRIKPGRDEKVLTSWNGLMISAFAKGYRITGDSTYLDAARRAVNFIEGKLANGEELKRTFKDGQPKLDGYLDDYAFYISALLDLFEVDSNADYLSSAIKYADYMIEHFWDQNNEDFFFTSDNHEKLIVRTKSIYDLSVPSGNSMAALALIRLYHYTQNQDCIKKAEKVLSKNASMAAENPFAFGQLLNTAFMYVRRPKEVTLITNGQAEQAIDWLNKQFLPEGIIAITNTNGIAQLQKFAFFKGKEWINDKPFTAYVCKDFACSMPLHSIDEIKKILNS
jgi:uncharacterized protein YyaL (SSP411 family)